MRKRVFSALVAVTAATLTLTPVAAQTPGIHRTDLSREPLSSGNRVGVQVLVEFEPLAVAPRHAHPGEELVYVVDGVLEYALDGKPPVILRAGDVLFIPNGRMHAVRNLSTGRSAELATYIVDPARPLAEYPPATPSKDRK